MYYPFIRGKQFELVMLREMARQLAEWNFVPVIEPVKNNFSALFKALDKLVEANCNFILIANPSVGELQKNSAALWEKVINGPLRTYSNYSAGLSLTANDSLATAENFFREHNIPTAVIHNGFSDGKGLASLINEIHPNVTANVFVMSHSSTLYRKHFKGIRVLIEDGFISRNNREYPPSEPFSELYLTYSEMGCNAFGDFLIVGGDYKDGGGPARAVAIHLTYKDPDADNAVSIRHYVSDQVDTLVDPAGKFFEALRKLVADVQTNPHLIYNSNAVKEYLALYDNMHFPGLGYVKKLSMQHHVELMSHLMSERD